MKGIPMKTWEIRAILDNRKTVTRRVVKPQHLRVLDSPYHKEHPETPDKVLLERLCEPPCSPRDILYVRETFFKDAGRYMYKANYFDGEKFYRNGKEVPIKWTPSIHMPREAARIFLRVTDVRVERLQDMSDEDLVRDFGFCWEAIQAVGLDTLAKPFWGSTIKPADRARYGWDANPWVWVIEFERCGKPKEDALRAAWWSSLRKGGLNMSCFSNGAAQRFILPERPLEPPEDKPLRYCTRCGGEIYYGKDTLCDGCLEETGGRKGMLEYMEADPGTLLKFLEDYRDEEFLDGFFETFYTQHEFAFERWRRS